MGLWTRMVDAVAEVAEPDCAKKWAASNEAVRDLRRALNPQPQREDRRASCDISVRDGGEPARMGDHNFGDLAAPGAFRRQHIAAGQQNPRVAFLNQTSLMSTLRLSDPYLVILDTAFESDSFIGEEAGHGDTSTARIVFAIFKVFVNAAIMFLPMGFAKAGWLMATALLIFFVLVCTHCVYLLIDVREHYGRGTFGQLACETLGSFGKLVDVSIVLSQFGYCTAIALFTSQILSDIFGRGMSLTLASDVFIWGQLLPLAPLCCIRKIRILAVPALVADAMIVAGLAAIMVIAVQRLATLDTLPEEVQAFNPVSWPLFLGTAVFSFEGIGNIMPIYDSMLHPEVFKSTFAACMAVICSLSVLFAMTLYFAFGPNLIPPTAILVLPTNEVGTAFQLGYALAAILSFPLVLLPAVRILEDLFWKPRSNPPFARKMQKNGFRAVTVAFVLFLSWAGAKNLTNVVALVGSLCCVPLGFLYPPLMHLVAFPQQRLLGKMVKIFEVALALFCIVFTSFVAISTF
eukprot:TRINITY_DN2731_c0_g1_i1.p1 TRINITY_DN2731_c0_g1~~TRINITY_DN2731_c0_g1_i1.p1  ORF type:complete len:518 (-),score=69.09 TRINITY_DN2731_c0_g1_i1:183-1736(-)